MSFLTGGIVPKTDGLTLKQRKWLQAYLETGNATEAAWQVYDCKDRDSASAIGSENLRKLSFSEILEAGGVTDAELIRVGREGLNATKVISANITYGEADGKTTDFIEVEDFPTRHSYLKTLSELKGHKVEKVDHTTQGEKINSVTVEFLDGSKHTSDQRPEADTGSTEHT